MRICKRCKKEPAPSHQDELCTKCREAKNIKIAMKGNKSVRE